MSQIIVPVSTSVDLYVGDPVVTVIGADDRVPFGLRRCRTGPQRRSEGTEDAQAALPPTAQSRKKDLP